MRTAAIVVAAGRGERLGAEQPKALVPLRGRSLLRHALERVAASGLFDHVVVVGPPDRLEQCRRAIPPGLSAAVVGGGRRRQDSVRRGLEALDRGIEIVVVHDAARPLASPALFRRVREEAIRSGAAVPILSVADTVKVLDGSGRIVGDSERERLALAQTPQGFRSAWLREAHERAVREGIEATDDAGLVSRLGLPVTAVPGEPWNLKITRPEDLKLAEFFLAEVAPEAGSRGEDPDQT
jgi:2-C-methyl-D-erythritol 4-phosphate cytidylyltransferase